MKRFLVGRENDGMIEQGRVFHDTVAHPEVPEFDSAAPLRLPVYIQVKNQVHPPVPVLMKVVHGEIGVNIQESTSARLMQPAAFQAGIGNQFAELAL